MSAKSDRLQAEYEQKQVHHAALLNRLEDYEHKVNLGTGQISREEREEVNALLKEAEESRKDLDRLEAERRRTPVNPTLPPRGTHYAPPGQMGRQGNGTGDDDGATLSAGEQFVHSAVFASFLEAGLPEANTGKVLIKSLWPGSLETKTIPVIGEGVVVPYRDPRAVAIPELHRLTLRDLFPVVGISSGDSVEYVIYSFVGEAKVVPEGAVKPDEAADFSLARAPVVVIAKWIPVSTQQLQDVAQLRVIVDGELINRIRYFEEQEVLWGPTDPTTGGFAGLMSSAVAVPIIPTPADGRAPADVVQAIAMGITDVGLRGGVADFVLLHPLDAEAIRLMQDTDTNYQNLIVNGTIWGLRMVVTEQMEEPGTTVRWMLVGDSSGATIYDRQQALISVGMINDQFTRNLRSILGEERVAFAVNKPHFFAKWQVTVIG